MGLRHRITYFVKQLHRQRAHRELAEEMRAHVEMDIEESVRGGLSPEQARGQARRSFGNVSRLREESHEASGFGSLDAWIQDLKTGVRVHRRSRGFAAAALISLALGIGANTVIFSLLDVALFRSLPVESPEELVIVGDPGAIYARWQGDWTGQVHPYPIYEKFRDRNDVFSGIFASGYAGNLEASLGSGEAPTGLGGARTRAVTGSYFDVLGVRPAFGRLLTSEDDVVPRSHPVAVVCHGFWTRVLGARPGVVGRTLRLDRAEFTIVGVAQAGFFGEVIGFPTEVWVPMMMQADVMRGRDWLQSSEHSWLQIMGRLAPGVTFDDARAQLNVLFPQLLREDINEHLSENDAQEVLERGLPVSSGRGGMTAMRDRHAEQLPRRHPRRSRRTSSRWCRHSQFDDSRRH